MKCGRCKSGSGQRKRMYSLTVQKPTGTADKGGHLDLTADASWQTVGVIRGEFTTKGGREAYIFKQTEAETQFVIKARWNAVAKLIHPSWRLKMGTRVFQIITRYRINETERWMQIEVKEEV